VRKENSRRIPGQKSASGKWGLIPVEPHQVDENEKESQNQDPTNELSNEDLEKVTGGAVNAYLIIDGRPGPATSKAE
jgi:hypothetical protein